MTMRTIDLYDITALFVIFLQINKHHDLPRLRYLMIKDSARASINIYDQAALSRFARVAPLEHITDVLRRMRPLRHISQSCDQPGLSGAVPRAALDKRHQVITVNTHQGAPCLTGKEKEREWEGRARKEIGPAQQATLGG